MDATTLVPRQKCRWSARCIWAALLVAALCGTAVAQSPPPDNPAATESPDTPQSTTQEVPSVLGKALLAIQEANPGQKASAELRIYSLEHVAAPDIATLLGQLFSVKAHALSKKLVVSATPGEQMEIEALVRALDVPENAAKNAAATKDPRQSQQQQLPDSRGIDAEHIEKLRRGYKNFEQRVQNVRSKIKSSGKPVPADDLLRQELRAAVTKAFLIRQQLLKAELLEFRQRMDRLGETIEQRERIGDQIIARRVEELLNPALKWDAAGNTEATSALPAEAAETVEPTAAQDLERLQGSWSIVKSHSSALPEAVEALLRGTFHFEKDRVQIVWDRGARAPEVEPRQISAPLSRVILTTNTNPRQIDVVDITDNKIRRRGIYSFEDGRLIIVFPLQGSSGDLPRPTKLAAANDVLYLELERQRAGERAETKRVVGPLDGTWVAISAEHPAGDSPDKEVQGANIQLVISGDKFSLTSRKGTRGEQGTLRIDSSVTPHTIDFVAENSTDPDSGPMPGIWELDRDLMRLSIGKVRPKSFRASSDPEAGERSYAFSRVPPASASAVSVLIQCTAGGQALERAIIDVFRQTYQPGAVHPRIERIGLTRTDEFGRAAVTLGDEIWKQESRSGYLVYVSGPGRGVQCLVFGSESHIAPPFPISANLEFDRDHPPAPMVPPGHLAIASRRGVTITESRDQVEGFAFKDEGATEYSTPAKTETRTEVEKPDPASSPAAKPSNDPTGTRQ